MSDKKKFMKHVKNEGANVIKEYTGSSTIGSKRKLSERTSNKRRKTSSFDKNKRIENEIFLQSNFASNVPVDTVESINLCKEPLYETKLVSMNEKSVFPFIVANEYVLQMVKNIMKLGCNYAEDYSEITSEPKYTRSKAKEKRKLQILRPWVLSFPLKKVFPSISETELLCKSSGNKDYKPCIEQISSNNMLLEENTGFGMSKDVYDAHCASEIWHNFVSQSINPTDSDDVENDPDYQITEEITPDFDELQFEEILRDELNGLVAETFHGAVHDLAFLGKKEDEKRLNLKSEEPCLDTNIMPLNIENVLSIGMTSDERLQLDEQLRMHVQLLSQSYLLSHGSADLHYINISSKIFLDEIKMYAMHERASKGTSAFYAQNLDEALAVINEFENVNVPLHSKNVSQPKKKSPPVPKHVKSTLATNKVFIYPELLPTCGFRNSAEVCKFFSTPEDNLIALGLEIFSEHPNPVEYIHDFLLPAKSVEQIKLRIKNSRSKKIPLTNPIKFYYEYNQAPQIPRVVRIFDPNNVRAPENYSPDFLPKWMESHSKPSKNHPPIPVLAPSQTLPLPSKLAVRRKCINPLEPKPKKFSPILPRGMHFSPLKQISPILKKYTQQRRVVPIDSFNSISPLKKSPYKPLKPKPNTPTNVNFSGCIPFVPTSEKHQLFKIPAYPDHVSLTAYKNIEECKELTYSTSKGEHIPSHPNKELVRQESLGNSSSIDKVPVDESSVVTKLPKTETVEVEISDEVDEEVLEDEQDTTVPVAVTTATKKHSISKKRNRHQRDLEASLALLQPTMAKDDPLIEERETMFVNSYLLRATEMLKSNPEVYEKFLSTLSKYHLSDGSPIELYSELSILLKDYPTLVRDFIVFLSPEQAKECGRYKECIVLSKIRELFRKIELHFKNQPQHITRILKAFTQLQQQVNITSADVINTLQPLLRNQSHLMEELNHLLPDVAPPEYLMTDFEDVTIPNSDDDDSSYDSCEEIIIPDTPDPYGGKDCPCECHKSTTDNRFLNKIRHCVKCGVKFIDGRIYIQTGKVLKPAQVIYHDLPTKSMKTEKLHSDPKLSKTQQTSETTTKTHLESDTSLKTSTSKSQQSTDVALRNVHIKPPVSEGTLKCPPSNEKINKTDVFLQRIADPKDSHVFQNEVLPVSDSSLPSISKLPCDVLEDAVFPAGGTSSKNKVSPSDFSQIRDMIGQSKKIPDKDCQSTLSRQNIQWTRDEDKLIIYNCQRYGITKKAIHATATAIKTRTVQEVLNRFMYLMVFLSKVIKKQ